MDIDNVTVIIRAVGERTRAACRDLIAQEVPARNICFVSTAPHPAMLLECYRVGAARRLPWTLCFDGDILLAPGRVRQLLAAAERQDESVFELQGIVLDKMFGVRRPAGNHLYRTALLPKAMQQVPMQGAIRPEHATKCSMAGLGHPWIELPLVLGLHDFEQYQRDIFRKCFVHARKFDHMLPLLVEYWRAKAAQDADYRVALGGIAAGIAYAGTVEVDVRQDRGYSRWAVDEGWTEKAPLAPDAVTSADVERTLATWESPGGALAQYEAHYTSRPIVHDDTASRLPAPSAPRRRGLLRTVPSVLGRALGRAGRRLERLAHAPA